MKCFIAVILMLFVNLSYSQNSVLDNLDLKKATIKYNGGKYNGYLIALDAPVDIVENAVKDRFKSQGKKPKETDGFWVYRNVILPRVDAVKPMDAFVKLERKSKKEKDKTLAHFIFTLPGEIPEEKIKSNEVRDSSNVTPIENVDAFLLGLGPAVALGVHDQEYLSQQILVKREEKKLTDLKEEQSGLESKIKKLQDDIQNNKKAQEKQVIEVDKSKNKLNELIAKKPVDPGQ